MRVILLALALLLAVNGWATEFHVAPTGNDSNPGTAAQPFATLERARDAMRSWKGKHQISFVFEGSAVCNFNQFRFANQ